MVTLNPGFYKTLSPPPLGKYFILGYFEFIGVWKNKLVTKYVAFCFLFPEGKQNPGQKPKKSAGAKSLLA